jgi:hypothetical protein
MSLESDGGMILTGENPRTRRKTCPSATLSTTNPTCFDPGANPGLRGEWPATNDLSHGTVKTCKILVLHFKSWIQNSCKDISRLNDYKSIAMQVIINTVYCVMLTGVYNPVPVAARTEAYVLIAWRLWVRMPLTAWIFVFVFLLLSCVRRGLASGWSPVQGVLTNVKMITNFGSNPEMGQVTRPNPCSWGGGLGKSNGDVPSIYIISMFWCLRSLVTICCSETFGLMV